MPKAKIRDLNMYYETSGKGFPLVMIMGLNANVDWWDPRIMSELSKRFKTIIFDNRGAGRTEVPKGAATVKMFADDTVGLMDFLKVQRAHVLGISMGGMIAQELALNYPDKVEKLILCSTSCGMSKSVSPSPQVLSLLMAGREGRSDEEVVKSTVPVLFPEEFIKSNPDYIKQVTARLLEHPITSEGNRLQMGAIMKFDTYSRLPNIKAPTLVMHGKKDILVPPQNGNIIAERIPGAKTAFFEKTGHALFSIETEKVTSALLQFLS